MTHFFLLMRSGESARGSDKRSGLLFSYMDLEARVRRDHALRAIKPFADAALEALSGVFSAAVRGQDRG
jgi:hypothetical protein